MNRAFPLQWLTFVYLNLVKAGVSCNGNRLSLSVFYKPYPLRLSGAIILLFASMPIESRAEIVLRVGDQKGNARAVLEASGVLDGAPYKLEWKEFAAAAPLLEAINAGSIDAGTVGDAPFTFAVASGVPIKAIAAIRWDSSALALLVRKSSPFYDFKDLAGKRVGTGRGSIGHLLILASLQAAGLQESNIKMVFLNPADAALALNQGAIDAWSTWEPYVAQAELAGNARVLSDGQKIKPGLTFFAARKDALEDTGKNAALHDFSRRLAKARFWGIEHLQTYSQTWSKIVGLPPEVAVKAFTRQNSTPVMIDSEVIADEQRTIELFRTAGLISRSFDAAAVLDPAFNDAVSDGELNK